MSAIPAAVPYTFWSTAIRRDIRAALYFCNCELRWRSTVCSTPLFQRAAGYFCSYEVLCLRIPQIYVHYSGKLQPKTTSEESVCRIICRLTPENCGMAGGLSLCPFKKAATRAELPFHYRCRSRQTFGVAKNICANFPKHPRKTTFRPQRSLRPFYSVTSKKGLHVFSANLGRHFLKSSNVERLFYPYFRDFVEIFNKSKLLMVRLHPHLQQHCFS